MRLHYEVTVYRGEYPRLNYVWSADEQQANKQLALLIGAINEHGYSYRVSKRVAGEWLEVDA